MKDLQAIIDKRARDRAYDDILKLVNTIGGLLIQNSQDYLVVFRLLFPIQNYTEGMNLKKKHYGKHSGQ